MNSAKQFAYYKAYVDTWHTEACSSQNSKMDILIELVILMSTVRAFEDKVKEF